MTTPAKKAMEAMEAAARARLAVVTATRTDRAEAAKRTMQTLPADHWLNDEEIIELIEWVLAESGKGPLASGVHTHRVCALLAEVLLRRDTAATTETTALKRLEKIQPILDELARHQDVGDDTDYTLSRVLKAFDAFRAEVKL